MILPMEKAVNHWKKIYIRDSAVDAIAHGAKLAVAGVLYLEKTIEKGEEIAKMTQKGELIAFGRAKMSAQHILKRNHGICATPEKVFLPRGLYPNWNDIENEISEEELEYDPEKEKEKKIEKRKIQKGKDYSKKKEKETQQPEK